MICFDLEGPLSPQDNAYELMGLFERGHEIFEVISRYDDLLVLSGREDYEPGDTLALIAPFLLNHGISEKDIRTVSDKAFIVSGARETITELKSSGWGVYIISTSYEQHAHNIGRQIGVSPENIACTPFPLDKYAEEFQDSDFSLINAVEKDILNLRPRGDDAKIKSRLDAFFWEELMESDLGRLIRETKVMGGNRKVSALQEFARQNQKDISELVVVGDSITDYRMLEEVNRKGGLAVVFNGNEYAIPYGTVSLATTNMLDILLILRPWEQGGRAGVENALKQIEAEQKPTCERLFHWLADKDGEALDEILKIHQEFRKAVRGQAAKLG